MSSKRFIDVDHILREKNPRLRKWLPGFIVRYIKRIVHQDEINEFLARNGEIKNQEFCSVAAKEFNIQIKVKHIERVPQKGKIVIAMNHPLGGMDALVLVEALRNQREDLKFIVNDILMHLENMKDLFVGVNKVGRNDRSLKQQIDDLFKSEQAICIFPSGMVSRKYEGKIQDLPWKKTFVSHARKHGQTIVPLYIDGRLSPFFYRLHSFRKAIGIKANIEMFWLVDELFKQKNQSIQFVVGKPVTLSELEGLSDNEAAQHIRKLTYDLKNEL